MKSFFYFFLFLLFFFYPVSASSQAKKYSSYVEAEESCNIAARAEQAKSSVKRAYCQGIKPINELVRDGRRLVFSYVCSAIPNLSHGYGCGTFDVWEYMHQNGCPPGSGPKPGYPGECLTSDDCLAKNAEGRMGGVRPWSNRCLANGCEVAFDPNAADYVKTTIGNKTMFSGTIEYTGKVCTAPDQWAPEQPDTPKPPELPPEQEQPPTEECTPLPHGQTACVKRNGDVCATASTGRQICWKPGETGRKTDKNVVQDKKPGDRTMPPSISIDNGDTADKSRDDIKIKEEFSGGRSSTTTIGTYETNSGANAGSSNQGSNSGGSGSSNGQDGGQEGGEEGGKGTYSGGETCDSPPVSTGDAQLAGIIHQQWLERCGEGSGLEVDVDTDPSTVFPDPSEGVGFDTRSIDSLGLDSSGFIGGGGSCPALADGGGSGKLSGAFATYLVSPPAWWCNLVAAIHYVMMALGAIASVYIMAGRKN